jgi:hypothetical protein
MTGKSSPDGEPDMTQEQYAYICRALLPEPAAEEAIAAVDFDADEGWNSYVLGDDPFTLAFAAVDPEIERQLLSVRPDLEPQIRALQNDLDGELARLREKYFT